MTNQQLLNTPRVTPRVKSRNKPLQGCPHKKGVCLKVYEMKPKKPNSAQRKVAKLRLSNKISVIGYIPGEGHNLQEHSVVLIEGGRAKDLPGVNFHLLRGCYDLKPVSGRKNGRSQYGVKKPR